MKIVLSGLIFISSVYSYADSKNKVRWPAQENPHLSRNIIQCDFPKNSLEITSLEIFASTSSNGSQVKFSNISSIVGISAHGGFKALSAGGNLTVSESKEIAGNIILAENPARVTFSKNIGMIDLNGIKLNTEKCSSIVK